MGREPRTAMKNLLHNLKQPYKVENIIEEQLFQKYWLKLFMSRLKQVFPPYGRVLYGAASIIFVSALMIPGQKLFITDLRVPEPVYMILGYVSVTIYVMSYLLGKMSLPKSVTSLELHNYDLNTQILLDYFRTLLRENGIDFATKSFLAQKQDNEIYVKSSTNKTIVRLETNLIICPSLLHHGRQLPENWGYLREIQIRGNQFLTLQITDPDLKN